MLLSVYWVQIHNVYCEDGGMSVNIHIVDTTIGPRRQGVVISDAA